MGGCDYATAVDIEVDPQRGRHTVHVMGAWMSRFCPRVRLQRVDVRTSNKVCIQWTTAPSACRCLCMCVCEFGSRWAMRRQVMRCGAVRCGAVRCAIAQ
jgi:hypothetical protein